MISLEFGPVYLWQERGLPEWRVAELDLSDGKKFRVSQNEVFASES